MLAENRTVKPVPPKYLQLPAFFQVGLTPNGQGDMMKKPKRILGVVVVALTALFAVACSSTAGNGPAAFESPATPQTVASLTLSVSPSKSKAAPSHHPPLGKNVAPLATGLAYIRGAEGHLVEDEDAYLAIDGDTDTIWSSEQSAPQWYSISLDRDYLIDRIEMVITQSPPGPTTHEIWLGHGSGMRVFYERLSDIHTEDGQTISVVVDPPQIVNEVKILTTHSPSWVAWRDLRVFGRQPEISSPSEKQSPFTVKEVAAGFEYPVRVTHAGDGSGRIFVVGQRGRIRIIKNGVPSETPFLDISQRVNCCDGERGLFGLAFPPSYPESQQFYLSYTDSQGDTRISRFSTSADPDLAFANSEEVLLTIEQPHQNHNGGHLAFGPQDGYLYIGSGDGGLPRDPENRGQTTDTLLGKILRIDVESGDPPYAIPGDNPSLHDDEYRPEIWATGLRNPWGFAFDIRNGDLYLPDTGNYKREEVNFQPAGSSGGQNYGWAIMEGNICFEHDTLTCSAEGLTLPVAEYDHTRGCAIVGGAVYQGEEFPALQGTFIVADYCTGHIRGIKRSEGISSQEGRNPWQSSLLAKAGMPISSVGTDEEGNIYFTGHAENTGVIYILAKR